MKRFEDPEIVITRFTVEDILTSSGRENEGDFDGLVTTFELPLL